MPSYPLTDVARDVWVKDFELRSPDLEDAVARPWSVTKRVLRGGRRDGVDLIQVDNGRSTLSIVPTRGMGLWKGQCGEDAIGWRSPITDGPVHPAFVNLAGGGGIGWLDGFDELMVRCGLENNGPPAVEGAATVGLHGKIANIPASVVTVHIDDETRKITIEGHVTESRLFGPRVRMVAKLATTPGSNAWVVTDEFHNDGDSPCELQVLYHWNFGPSRLEAGAQFVAPLKTVVPRDARAVAGLDHYATYGGPEPGFAEQVYFCDLHGAPRDGGTVVLLRNRLGDKGVALRFLKEELPCFTLWKRTGGLKEGYVTGLEPATNYPNPKPFERARGRVVSLPPGGRYRTATTLEVLTDQAAVAAIEDEIHRLQARGAPTIHPRPVEPFAPET